MDNNQWRRFLSARWENLVFISFRVSKETLEPYLPIGTVLDLYEGSPVMSLVAFEFLNTKIWGFRPPLFHSFAELNLRFYVRNISGGERGVVFIKEICPYSAVAWTARILFNEKFLVLPCKMKRDASTLIYQFPTRNRDQSGKIVIALDAPTASSGDEAFSQFAVSRYDGFSKWGRESTLHYHIEHEPWEVQAATLKSFELDIEGIYDTQLVGVLKQPPISVLYSCGSHVELSSGKVRSPSLKRDPIWQYQNQR